jgi:hypothetical protein
MKTLKILIFTFLVSSVFSQITIKKQSIDSGGALVQNGNIKMLFTVGELAVAEKTSGTYLISEGFIDPNINFVLGLIQFEVLTGVNVFPNPVIDKLHIKFPDQYNYLIEIYDINGKILKSQFSNSSVEIIVNISDLQMANYFLVIKDIEHKKLKLFKLLKTE